MKNRAVAVVVSLFLVAPMAAGCKSSSTAQSSTAAGQNTSSTATLTPSGTAT